MPYLLRTLRKNKFEQELQPDWAHGEIQADALKDIQTNSNQLSVWQIDDERTNLDRVLAAVAATKDSLSNIDYALLDISVIDGLGIEMVESPGEVPDDAASQSHRDLVRLTAGKVAEFAGAISTSAALERCTKGQLRKTLIHSVNAGHIDKSRINEALVNKLR